MKKKCITQSGSWKKKCFFHSAWHKKKIFLFFFTRLNTWKQNFFSVGSTHEKEFFTWEKNAFSFVLTQERKNFFTYDVWHMETNMFSPWKEDFSITRHIKKLFQSALHMQKETFSLDLQHEKHFFFFLKKKMIDLPCPLGFLYTLYNMVTLVLCS